MPFAFVGLSPEDHQPLSFRAGAPRLGSVHTFSGKKRKLSLLMMIAGSQSTMVTRISLDEGRVGATAESVEKMKDVTDATIAASGALQSEPNSAF